MSIVSFGDAVLATMAGEMISDGDLARLEYAIRFSAHSFGNDGLTADNWDAWWAARRELCGRLNSLRAPVVVTGAPVVEAIMAQDAEQAELDRDM